MGFSITVVFYVDQIFNFWIDPFDIGYYCFKIYEYITRLPSIDELFHDVHHFMSKSSAVAVIMGLKFVALQWR